MRVLYDNSAYVAAKAKLPKPDGKHCIICGKSLPKFARKYCSSTCFARWYTSIEGIQNWSVIRWKAFERDNFTCRKCGFQDLPKYIEYHGKRYLDGMPKLNADHIQPLFLGGSEFDLINVQTLCEKCHKKKSELEAKLRTKIECSIRNKGQTRLFEVQQKKEKTEK